MAENIKNAEIVIQNASPAALDEGPLDGAGNEALSIAFADKLGDILSSNSDILGVLGKIRKDVHAISSHILKSPSRGPLLQIPRLTAQEKPAKPISKTPARQTVKRPVRARISEKTKEIERSKETVRDKSQKIKSVATDSKAKEAKVTREKTTLKAIKPEIEGKAKPEKTASQKTREVHQNEKERVKDRQSLLGGLKDAVLNVGTVGVNAATSAIQDQDLTDIAGTAIGGPLWEVVKEVKEVADNTDFSKVKGAKAFLTGKKKVEKSALPFGARKDSAGRLRDGRGKYLTTKPGKVAGRSEAKSKIIERKNSQNIEDQKRITEKLSELGVQTIDSLHDSEREEETRHKDLIKAVEHIDTGGNTIGSIRHGRDLIRGVRDRRRGRKTAKRGRKSREMVERKRRPGAMGRIKTPADHSSPKRRGRGGKFGKIAGLLGGIGGLAGGGGLLSGFFGGGNSVTDMVTEQVLSTVGGKSAGMVSSAAATRAASVAPAMAKPATKAVSNISSKGASKMGLKGAAKLGMKGAGFGLRALGPLAAVGMAGYDAFQGWNDKDMQARAFGLKDGQEATTGQKASSSLANVLDLGGLGTGLLSMFGVDTDTADIAKGVHGAGSWIGGALGMTGQKDSEKDIIQKAISAPIATVTEGVKSIWGWITGEKDKDAQIKTAETVSPATSMASSPQKAQASPTSKIDYPQPLPKIEKVNAGVSQNTPTTDSSKDTPIDEVVLKRLIRALEKNVRTPLLSTFQKPNQQPQAPKSNIKADFDDTMLTLMAYDRM